MKKQYITACDTSENNDLADNNALMNRERESGSVVPVHAGMDVLAKICKVVSFAAMYS